MIKKLSFILISTTIVSTMFVVSNMLFTSYIQAIAHLLSIPSLWPILIVYGISAILVIHNILVSSSSKNAIINALLSINFWGVAGFAIASFAGIHACLTVISIILAGSIIAVLWKKLRVDWWSGSWLFLFIFISPPLYLNELTSYPPFKLIKNTLAFSDISIFFLFFVISLTSLLILFACNTSAIKLGKLT